MGLKFKCKETEKIWFGEHSRRLPTQIQGIIRRKLRALNNVKDLEELQKIPGNRLEKLSGSRKGEFSLRINDQWRVCFKWIKDHAEDVIIQDYH